MQTHMMDRLRPWPFILKFLMAWILALCWTPVAAWQMARYYHDTRRIMR